jgi:hypothetical protein
MRGLSIRYPAKRVSPGDRFLRLADEARMARKKVGKSVKVVHRAA